MRAEHCEKARANSRVTKGAFWGLIGLATSMSLGTVGLPQSAPVVRVDGGELQGVAAEGVVSFKGIPFAAPPVGDLRWRPPQPAAKWTGVRQAAEFGEDCMQGRFGPPPGCARRSASGSRRYSRARSPSACSRPRRSGSVGGLPISERVASGRFGRPQSARDGVDLWGRVHGRFERVAQYVGRRVRHAGRRPRRHELPCRALRFFRVSGLEQRASG